MAGSLQPRVKTWVSTEEVVYSDLNAEFDNVLLAMQPLLIDDYSANTAQMQVTTDPGEVGTESLATTLAGEIARLRHLIGEITGEDQWYETPVSSLLGLANAIGSGLTDNRLVSGRVAATSAQPMFLVPNGAARTIKLDGTPTSFVYYVEGTEYSISTDVTLTNLTAAPSSNNTCDINDANAADQYWTKYAGEDGSEIPVDGMGTEISALVGKFAAFKLTTGASSEYFYAYVKSSTSITKARRGFFFDSADAAIPRIVYADNDVITLMKLTWIFAKTDGTLTATYTNPVWADDEPTSPAVNDYWFDTSANKWKRYDVASFVDADAMLAGICIQDTSNTVGARSFEFFKNYNDDNSVELFAESNSQIKSRYPGNQINVWGATIKNDYNIHTWNMTLDLETGVTEGSSTYYYFYITETGDKIISDKKPHDRRGDLKGYYHPHESWRCVGWAFNNSSSNLEQVESYFRSKEGSVIRSVAAADVLQTRDRVIILSGSSYSEFLPPAALSRGNIYTFIHNGTSLSQAYTLDGYGSETIGGSTTVVLYTNRETLKIISDGSNWLILDHYAQTGEATGGAITITGTGGNPTKPTGIVVDRILWRRNGNNCFFRLEYKQSNTTSAAAGTGDYLFALPSNITMDTTVMTLHTAIDVRNPSALGAWAGISTSQAVGIVVPYDSTHVRLSGTTAAGEDTVGAGFLALNGDANLCYAVSFCAPISGWLP